MSVATLFAVASAAVAAPQMDFADLEEVVVTGERVPRTLRDTASSALVIGARDIDAQAGADNINQLLETVPNLTFGTGGLGPTVRGQDSTGVLNNLPAFLGGTRPRMTLQVDGRPQSYNESAFGIGSIWDLQRVEVFRSPQTTTQGRNSIAGGIFVETQDPTFTPTGRARVIVGDAATRQFSGVLSGPVMQGRLAVRVAADSRRGRPASRLTIATDVDPNRDDFDVLRLKLLAAPRTPAGARLDLSYQHNRSQSPQTEGVRAPFERRTDPLATYGVFTLGVDSLTGRLRYSPAHALESRTTVSAGRAGIERHAPPGLGQTHIAGRDISLESILDWRSQGRLALLGGVYFSRATLAQEINLAAVGLGQGTFDDRQQSRGVFGELRWRPAARTSLVAGLRHQHDLQDRSGALAAPSGTIPLSYRKGFQAWLPKVTASIDLTPAVRVGALVQRAYNPGGTTISLATRANDEFDAESLWDYELFLRSSLAGGAINLNANVFFYDMRSTQLPQNRELVTPGGTAYFAEIDNARRARSKGMELELGWQAGPHTAVRAAIGLLETRILQTLADVDPLLGKQFQRSPAFTTAWSMLWNPTATLELSAQLRYHSAYYSDDANSAGRRIEPGTLLDARAAWSRGRVSVFGYARNLLDDFQLTYRFGVTSSAPELAVAAPARQLGLGLEARL